MAAVELERLFVALYLAPQSCKRLYRRGRRLRQQFRNMAASAHAAHCSVKSLWKPVEQAGPDERRIRGRDLLARTRIGHLVRLHLDGTDHIVSPDSDPHPHLV